MTSTTVMMMSAAVAEAEAPPAAAAVEEEEEFEEDLAVDITPSPGRQPLPGMPMDMRDDSEFYIEMERKRAAGPTYNRDRDMPGLGQVMRRTGKRGGRRSGAGDALQQYLRTVAKVRPILLDFPKL